MPVHGLGSHQLKAALTILLASVLFSGCPGSGETDSNGLSVAQGANILRYDVPYPFGPFVLNPHKQLGSNFVFPFIFGYLAVPDQNGKLQPDLAEKWTYDANNFTWTFYLRQNARFHNGKTVTSKDAADSLQIYFSDLSAEIRCMETPSDRILVVKLSHNDPNFLEKIWDFEILPGAETSYSTHEFLIGSGPFVLKERNAQSIVLEANADYFRGRPALDGMIFYFEPDKERTWTRLMAGQTDVAAEIAPENAPITQMCEDRFYINCCALPYYSIVLFNARDPLFSDIRVRQALSLSVDREYIVRKILNGNGKLAAGPMDIAPERRKPRSLPQTYNPAKALRLLAQAGWTYDEKCRFLFKNEKPFEFTLYAALESPVHELVIRHLRLCFNDIGIKLYVKLMPLKDLMRSYLGNSEFQAALTELQGSLRTYEDLIDSWSANLVAHGIEDAKTARLIKSLSKATAPDAQMQLLCEIDQSIADLHPGVFLYHETVCDVMSRRFVLPGPFYLNPARGWVLQLAALRKNGEKSE